ncbi:hypothetical protein KUL25_18980 [Rhodobacteraceae bacterium N5(2021)]|uniref:Uncharacterized protein n=1 Tax=Gymnodinialimonas phycosphaerae TaxID=2841589 RepID=A0A975YFI5_9RHOB|nr:hypothetical protein [Gymnodinialimonas phycosphaerae]MBY4894847.1 hypothetical protein [Gymnodinialimonas phycosphaerae]
MPSPEEILSIDREKIAAFIQDQASAKTLSPLVKQLNELLIAGDEAASHLAARALRHLGFAEYA